MEIKSWTLKSLKQLLLTAGIVTFFNRRLYPKKVDIQILMKYYDPNKDGCISYNEFLEGLKEPMNKERKIEVEKLYEKLDPDNTGKIRIEDIRKIYSLYSAENHPDFKSGKKTKEELTNEFVKKFENVCKNQEGIITKEEFFDVFTDISTLAPNDDYFISLVGEPEAIPASAVIGTVKSDKEEELVPKERVDALINTVRAKLLTLSKTQDEYLLRKLLDEYDTDRSGGISVDEFIWLLYKLGIAVEKKYVLALFERFDLNKSGAIDYEEFCYILTQHTYTR